MAGAGDAGDQRGKDQGRDDHLDQAQEELAERPEVDGPVGVEVADEPADDDPYGQTDEDLLCKADPGGAGSQTKAGPCGVLILPSGEAGRRQGRILRYSALGLHGSRPALTLGALGVRFCISTFGGQINDGCASRMLKYKI